MKSEHFLQAILSSQSIAIIGASSRKGSPGQYLWEAATGGGFRGRLFPVNPKWKEIGGQPCLHSLKDLKDTADLAVVATPIPSVSSVLEEVADAGVQSVVLCTGELACTGGRSLKFDRDVRKTADSLGLRLIGGGSLGIIRPSQGLNLSFHAQMPRAGSIGLVAQSGSIASALCDTISETGFGFSAIIHTGAEIDVCAADAVDFLAEDPLTRVIALEISRVSQTRKLFSAIRAAARRKPVIVFWSGSETLFSAELLGSTLSHCGAIQAHSFSEFSGLIEIFSAGIYPRGPRLAVLSSSMSLGGIAAQAACGRGAELSRISLPTAQAIRSLANAGIPQTNPIDMSVNATADVFASVLSALLEDDEVDGVILVVGPTPMADFGKIAKAISPAAARRTKPVLTVMTGGSDAAKAILALRQARLWAGSDPDAAGHLFAQLAAFAIGRARQIADSSGELPPASYDIEAARRILEHARSVGHYALDEQETKSLLACFGIAAAVGIPAGSAAEAANAARALGFPVALKVQAAGVTSKSDIGGVILDVECEPDVREAFEAIRESTLKMAPFAEFQGVLVERMVHRTGARELSAGISQDSAFGPVVHFGAGGIFGQAFHDQCSAAVPLAAPDALRMLGRPACSTMLGEFRGAPAVNQTSIAQLLVALSEIARRIPALKSLTIDPVLATQDEAIALDAHAVVSDAPLTEDAAASHLAFAPVPDTPHSPLETPLGTLLMRPIEITDAALEKRFLSRLSEKTAAMRFHAPVHKLTAQQICDFVDIDYDRHIAIAAVDVSTTPQEIRAIARAALSADGRHAEFGIVVEDAWQRQGLASRLMRELEKKALSRGVNTLAGLVLRSNSGMEKLMDLLGYERSPDQDDPSVALWTLELAPAPLRRPRKRTDRSLVGDVIKRARETMRAR